MPRTPYGIFYPDSDDDIQGSIEEMMLSIDSAVSTLQDDTVDLDKIDGIRVYQTAKTVTSGVLTSIDFTGAFFDYDTGPYWNVGTPTRFALPAGWWMINVRGSCLPAAGYVSVFDLYAVSNTYNSITRRQLSSYSPSGGHCIGGLYCHPGGGVSDYLEYKVLFIGSVGGTASISSIQFDAHKIRDL
jgi:hypothetical protein